MQKEQKQLSRKKFLSWVAGIGAVLTIPAFLQPSKKKKQTKTVKMLTREGKLVLVEVENIPEEKKKIKPDDIHTWVVKKGV
jgi:hypothetical protein